jgi:hypothetical protein
MELEVPRYVLAYVAVAFVAVVISLGLLRLTKIPAIVMVGAALLTAVTYLLYARISTGYWDKFAAISFAFVAAYACVVSIVLLAIGRLLRWPFFLSRPK